jgi:hypothetical protein
MRGTVRLDGGPLAGQQVMLVAPSMEALWGSAVTNDGGEFEIPWKAADAAGEAHLLVKVKAPVVGVLHRTVRLPDPGFADVQAETSDGFFTLAASVESPTGEPKALVLRVDPVRVAGVPERLEPFFKQVGPGVFESIFATVPASGGQVAVTLREGTYKIGADSIDYDRPRIVDPGFDNYIAAALRIEGRNAPGDQYGGFLVEITRDTSGVLVLRVLDNAEL